MEGMEVDSMRLFELRVEKMLSQEDLHQLSGVSRDTISRLERGESQAQYRTIRKLADALESHNGNSSRKASGYRKQGSFGSRTYSILLVYSLKSHDQLA